MIANKAKPLPQAGDFKPSIESINSASKESVNVCPECIMCLRVGQSEESDPTEVQIQSSR